MGESGSPSLTDSRLPLLPPKGKTTMPRKKKIAEATNGTSKEPPVPETPTEVAVVESDAKREFRAYVEDLKRKDPHEYSVREPELLRKLNQS